MLFAPTAAQASYSMSNGNSAASYDPASPIGLESWVVDGISQLAQQSWYFRIGDTAEAPLSSLGTPVVTQLASNIVQAYYAGESVEVTLRYTLIGGSTGSGNSTIAEMMRIRNKTAAPMAFHLFEYTDLDLNGTPDDDSAAHLNATTIGQWDGAIISTETASVGGMTPTPNYWELGPVSSIINKLNDDSPSMLSNAEVSLNRVNTAFAFQWEMNLAAGASQILSKSKTLLLGGAIGDTVFFDTNENGVQDSSEPGIGGVTITLDADFDNDGVIDYTTSTVTDSGGFYMFANLLAGHYTVSVDRSAIPDGAIQTCDFDGLDTPDTAELDIVIGETNLDVDFGYIQHASIGDRVWNDKNANGVQDAGEVGINGVTVTLKDENGNVIDTAFTSGDGNYIFDELAAGSYTVAISSATLPSGMAQTYDLDGILDNSTVVALASGENRIDVDFGYVGNAPGIHLVKTGPATAKVGDTITYHFKVTNTGNTYLYGGVTVNDPMLGGNVWHKTPVAPGEVNEFDLTYVVKSSSTGNTGCYDGNYYNFGGCGRNRSHRSSSCDSSRSAMCGNYKPGHPGGGCGNDGRSDDSYVLVNTATAIGCPPTGSKVTSTSSCQTVITSGSCYQTYTQGGWGSKPCGSNPGTLLSNNFCKVYGRCGLTIGGCKKIKFTCATAIKNFLPAGGKAASLTYSATDLKSTSAGVFAGQVLALRLNVDFSNAGITCCGLGDIKLTSGSLCGKKISEVLTLAESVLGGNTFALPCGMSISQLNDIVDGINQKYNRD